MKKRRKLAIAGIAALAVVGAGTGIAVAANSDDDDESPITGDALEQAEAAALEHTGEGRVTETEVGDEESYYEVEVTLDDGSQVDVQLDRDLNVVGDERDPAGKDQEGDGDDE